MHSPWMPHDGPVLRAAARVLCRAPYATVSLGDVAAAAIQPESAIRAVFPTMHTLGSAVLDHEWASMRQVQVQAASVPDPLLRLRRAMALVGECLADDIVTRAGVRIAGESGAHFPDRRIDPFATWQRFVEQHLTEAVQTGRLRDDAEVPALAWTIVAAGVGTRDLVAHRESWHEAPERLRATLDTILRPLERPAR